MNKLKIWIVLGFLCCSNDVLRSSNAESPETNELIEAFDSVEDVPRSKTLIGKYEKELFKRLDEISDANLISALPKITESSLSEVRKGWLLAYYARRFAASVECEEIIFQALVNLPAGRRIEGKQVRWWLSHQFGVFGLQMLIRASQVASDEMVRSELNRELESCFSEWVPSESSEVYADECSDWLKVNRAKIIFRPATSELPLGLLPSDSAPNYPSPIYLDVSK